MNHKAFHMGRKQKLTTKKTPSFKTNIPGNGNAQNKYKYQRQYGEKKWNLKKFKLVPATTLRAPCEIQQPRDDNFLFCPMSSGDSLQERKRVYTGRECYQLVVSATYLSTHPNQNFQSICGI